MAVDRSTGAAVLRTRGDANTADDAWSARLTTTKVPVVVAVAPGLGRLTLLVQDPRTRALLIALLGLVVTTLAVREVLHLPLVVPPARSSSPVPTGTP